MNKTGMFATLLICASLCAPPVAQAQDAGSPESADEQSPGVEEVLKRAPSQSDYVTADRCIGTRDYYKVEVLNSDVLAFSARRGRAWINRLPKRCDGLRRGLVLNFAVEKRQICVGGWFEGLQNGTLERMTRLCYLGVFLPATKDQVAALARTLKRK